jgi:hypothetical protein
MPFLVHKLQHFFALLSNSKQRRHILRWIISLQSDYMVRYRQPWITFDAIDFLTNYNLRNKRVFEYGSGGSTLFWLDKGAICVSIEHDQLWYQKMINVIGDQERADYRFIGSESDISDPSITKDYSDPDQYISSQYTIQKSQYKKYVQQVDEFDDGFFDLILIDGRARPSCIKHSWPKVKSGGLLILDNADREYYTKKTTVFLQNFECMEFLGAVPNTPIMSLTNIYVKKS